MVAIFLYLLYVVSGVWFLVVGDHGKGLMWERLGEERQQRSGPVEFGESQVR